MAFELERRVTLSRYLLRVNDAGAEPPQETGLLCNSWSGKHHSEMRWWHQAHWALWGNANLLARSDAFYFDLLPNATSYAASQGYPGAHWPKETAAVSNRAPPPTGAIDVPWLGLDRAPWPFPGQPTGSLLAWESPQVDNALILWQQPHLVALPELQRRAANASGGHAAALAEMRRLAPLVLASADYLAARVYFNESDGARGGSGGGGGSGASGSANSSEPAGGAWWLGPPLVGGQETGDPLRTYNPTFELVYLAAMLDVAAEWRAVLGLPANPAYERIAGNLAALPTDPASPPTDAPLYVFDRFCVCQYLRGGTRNSTCRAEWVPPGGSNCPALSAHPTTVAPFGTWNGLSRGERYGVSPASANATLRAVWGSWGEWGGAWGWDDAVLAQAMARLGWSASTIVEGPLMDPKFPFYRSGQTLCCPTYLPGNGGLLLTIAMLAGGSENSPPLHFPPEWGVRAEGFNVKYF